MKKQFLTILALLLMAAGGTVAQNTNSANVQQLTKTSSGSWTLSQMPSHNSILSITFREYGTLDNIPLTWTVMVNNVDKTQQVTPYTSEQGDTTLGWLSILEGDTVELIPPAAFRRNVRYVELDEPVPTLDLATVTEATTVEDGYTVTGTLGANVKISIEDGATVTLDGVTINGEVGEDYQWAGITCLGDATIILSGTNTVKGFLNYYPGIHVPENKTLTIQGSGSLTASSNGSSCGIGGGYEIAGGNIVIAGGTITATGGGSAAGIGGGHQSSCGTITITGGTVNANGGPNGAGIGGGGTASCGDISITGGTITANGGGSAAGIGGGYIGQCGNISITGGTINATGGNLAAGIGSGGSGSCGNISITGGNITATGGNYAAGIGGGNGSSCGNITITNGVTSVTATKGKSNANYSIGPGKNGQCGTVTIGGTTGAITTSPYTYPQN